jgi:hypothetical protein
MSIEQLARWWPVLVQRAVDLGEPGAPPPMVARSPSTATVLVLITGCSGSAIAAHLGSTGLIRLITGQP